MKVIDLLNKIANGEATNESEFILKGEGQITNMNLFADDYFFNTEMLNKEIKETKSKIEQCNFDISKVFQDLDIVQVSQFTTGIVDKINEIIDKINEMENK